ncbi:MAG TPA: hypothetical protein VGI92_12430 [Gemmatimonadales bacterium]|jgi:hypothetical protein
MKDPVVVAHSDAKAAARQVDNQAGWSYLFAAGLGITIVALIEVILMFLPARWSSLDWEFGTIAGMFDSLPLMTVGLGSMCAAAVANGWRAARISVAVLSSLLSLMILVMALIFALDIPAVLRAADLSMQYSIKLGSLKAGLEAGVYFLLYLALGVWTWRRIRRTKRAGRHA